MNSLMKVNTMVKILDEYAKGTLTMLDSRLVKPAFKPGDWVRTIKDNGEPTGGIPFQITSVMVIDKNPKIKDKIWWKSSVGWYKQANLEKVNKNWRYSAEYNNQ